MGNRPDVETAQAPSRARHRAPGPAARRRPGPGPLPPPPAPGRLQPGGPTSASRVTREVIRSFMGYASSLPIPEFRSHRARARRHVQGGHAAGRPLARRRGPRRRARRRARHPLPAREARAPAASSSTCTAAATSARRPPMYAFFTSRLCKRPAAPSSWPTTAWPPSSPSRPAWRTPPRPSGPGRASACPTSASSWPATRAGAGWPTRCCCRARADIQTGPPGRADPLLARGRPAPRRALGHRQRQARHLAVEHPDRLATCTARTPAARPSRR